MKIRYIGELLDYTGYGEAARINVALLAKMGHQLECVPIGSKTPTDTSDWKMEVVARNMASIKKPDLIIAHIYPPSNLKKYIDGTTRMISYVAWETDMLPSIWSHHLNKYADAVITTCTTMRDVFIKSGVSKPVYVLGPTTFEEDIKEINIRRPERAELPPGLAKIYNKDKFIFYSVFQWIERKDPFKLVSAFIQEFDNTEDDVMLLMKSYRLDFSKEETKALVNSVNTLNQELNIIYTPEVRLISNRLSDAEMRLIHRMCSCYVSPHRGEGSGLGIIDAILYEHPAIITPFGGPSDFTSEKYTRWLKYNMIPIRNPLYCYNYFNAHMMWADVDIMDLRHAMRSIYQRRDEIGKSRFTGIDPRGAKEYLLKQYNFEAQSKSATNILENVTTWEIG